MNLHIDNEQRTLKVLYDSEIHSFKLFNHHGFLVESELENNTFNFSELSAGTNTVCITDKENRFLVRNFLFDFKP